MRQNKFEYITLLRTIACLSVILLHYSGSYTYRFGVPTFNQGVLIFTLSRFCVPIFVMISGALLLEKSIPIGEFYKRRFSRILPPFIFWSTVYLVFKSLSEEVSFNNIFDIILNQGAEFHFWYVYMFFGLILFIPFISPWTEKKEKRSIQVFILIWFLWSLFTYTFTDYIKNDGLSYLAFGYFIEYIGYLILGYYLHIRDDKKYDWIIGVVFFFISITYGYFTSIEESYKSETFVQFFLNYKSWNIILMSIGVFLIVKQIKISNKILNEISKYSFGIYLAHIIVRNILVANYFEFLNFEDYSFLFIKSVIVLFFSYVIVKLINKIPFIGKYISG